MPDKTTRAAAAAFSKDGARACRGCRPLPGEAVAPPSRADDARRERRETGDSPCCCPAARRDGRPERGPARLALMAAPWAARGSGPGLDEFTVPAEKRRFLEGSRGRIQGLFEVRLAVLEAQGDWRPALPPPGQPPPAARIWVQLAGGGKAVRSAKVWGGERGRD